MIRYCGAQQILQLSPNGPRTEVESHHPETQYGEAARLLAIERELLTFHFSKSEPLKISKLTKNQFLLMNLWAAKFDGKTKISYQVI